MDTSTQQILPYAFFLIYARAHHQPFMRMVEQLRSMYLNVRRLHSQKRKVLPIETMREVTTYLDAVSLCRCAMTCTTWRTMCDRIELWEHLCQADYKISSYHFLQHQSFRKAPEGSDDDNDDDDDVQRRCAQKRPRTGSAGAHPKELYRLARTSLQMLLRGHAQRTPPVTFTATNLPAIHVPLMIHS